MTLPFANGAGRRLMGGQRPRSVVTVAGETFTLDLADTHRPRLTNARGDEYYLRPFLGERTGRHEVVSSSGKPFWDRHRRVARVLWLGDVIEEMVRD
jgi:hypothetical protein